jgi:hypothetical protein
MHERKRLETTLRSQPAKSICGAVADDREAEAIIFG